MSVFSAEKVEAILRDLRIPAANIDVREYPNETNVLIFVEDRDYTRAINESETIEKVLAAGSSIQVLVVIRKALASDTQSKVSNLNVHHPRAAQLQRLISARNRVSEVQPSLSYIPDLAGNLAPVTAQRHHLIFGRRGVGKSTLLVEARSAVGLSGALTAWINLQTLRWEGPERIFLRVARELVKAVLVRVEREQPNSRATGAASELYDRLGKKLAQDQLHKDESRRFIPDIQAALHHGLELLGSDFFVFIDDFYYIPRADQPEFLDILHGCVRDCRAWLKIASIRNLTRWFQANPPVGLQTGHDADLIDLDITLQEPSQLRIYLEKIMLSYCLEAGVARIASLFRRQSLDRLVLASGGVPRDFLVLASAAIERARENSKSKVVGIQNVNTAAGNAADVKLQELEEDVASNKGLISRTLAARLVLRQFCLTDETSTFFRIDFEDKERSGHEYQIFIDLLDLRLVHLVHASVSDAREAGRKYEIYMLDLSQYTGTRLKQGLRVLDLEGDSIIARTTRTRNTTRRVTESRTAIALYRTAPIFPLSLLAQDTAVDEVSELSD